jgi:hypothetical protein
VHGGPPAPALGARPSQPVAGVRPDDTQQRCRGGAGSHRTQGRFGLRGGRAASAAGQQGRGEGETKSEAPGLTWDAIHHNGGIVLTTMIAAVQRDARTMAWRRCAVDRETFALVSVRLPKVRSNDSSLVTRWCSISNSARRSRSLSNLSSPIRLRSVYI